jgi:hypothetical protein
MANEKSPLSTIASQGRGLTVQSTPPGLGGMTEGRINQADSRCSPELQHAYDNRHGTTTVVPSLPATGHAATAPAITPPGPMQNLDK